METLMTQEGQVVIQSVQQENSLMVESLKKFVAEIPAQIARFGYSLIIAVILLIVGFKFCNVIRKAINKVMTRAKVDVAVIHFTEATFNVIFKALIILAAASIIGFDKAGITAVIGSVSIAIGLSVQGSLSNFAGGILILTLKPFVIGDYIVETSTKQEGRVEHISIFYTKIVNDLGNAVVLPNGELANSTVINKTNGSNTRRAVAVFQVSYKEDIGKVKDVLLNAMKKENKYFLHEIGESVVVTELSDSGVQMKAIAAVKNDEHYMDACFELNEIIKNTLDSEGISIPFPQLDVHFDK